MADVKEVSATGVILAVGTTRLRPAHLFSVVLTAAADAATAVVRTGGASGTKKITLAAPIGTSAVWMSGAGGVDMSDGIHVTITGTAPACDVEFVE